MSDVEPIDEQPPPVSEIDFPPTPSQPPTAAAGPGSSGLESRTAQEESAIIQTHEAMLKGIRSWGFWLLGIGVLQLVGSSASLDPTWGILLLIVGAASFLFQDAAMYVVYGVTLAWAAISNAISGLSSGGWGWAAFAVFQVYLAFTVFRNYVKYRRNQQAYDQLVQGGYPTATLSRAARFFPFIGCGMAALGGIATVAFLAVLIGVAVTDRAIPLTPATWLVGLAIDFLVIGLAVSLSALLGRFRYRALPILACIGAGLVLAIWLLFMALS